MEYGWILSLPCVVHFFVHSLYFFLSGTSGSASDWSEILHDVRSVPLLVAISSGAFKCETQKWQMIGIWAYWKAS